MPTTLNDVLDRTNEIKLAATKLGFEENVRLCVDGGNELYLVVSYSETIPPEKRLSQDSYLRLWLTHLLQCSVFIYTPESTKNTIHADSVKEAISLDDQTMIKEKLGNRKLENVVLLEDELSSRDIEYLIPKLEQMILGKTSGSKKNLFTKNGKGHQSDDAANAIIKILPTLTPPQLGRVRSAIEELNEKQKELKDHSPQTNSRSIINPQRS